MAMLATLSFDDLVGADHDRWRHCEVRGLGCLEIDHKLELGRLLDRDVGRLRALGECGSPLSETDLSCGIMRVSPPATTDADNCLQIESMRLTDWDVPVRSFATRPSHRQVGPCLLCRRKRNSIQSIRGIAQGIAG
jgi:hypothetical protein